MTKLKLRFYLLATRFIRAYLVRHPDMLAGTGDTDSLIADLEDELAKEE